MPDPHKVLSAADYRNYRNTRAIALVYFIFGGLAMVGGLIKLIQSIGGGSDPDRLHPLAAAGVVFIAFVLSAGGFVVLHTKHRWMWLGYSATVLSLFAVPIGTILGVVMLAGLSRYLKVCAYLDQLSAQEAAVSQDTRTSTL